MDAKIIQEFKGFINGIEITDREIYYECEYILSEIENTLNIELPTSLIRDFINAYKYIFYSLESEFIPEFKSDMVSSWDYNIKSIKELKFDLSQYLYRDSLFDQINENIKDWDNTYNKYKINLGLKE